MGCPTPAWQAVTALSPRPPLASTVHSLIFPEWMLSRAHCKTSWLELQLGIQKQSSLCRERCCFLRTFRPDVRACGRRGQERPRSHLQPNWGRSRATCSLEQHLAGAIAQAQAICSQEPPQARQSLLELPLHQTHCRLVGLVKGEGSLLVRDPHSQCTTHSMIPLQSTGLIPV